MSDSAESVKGVSKNPQAVKLGDGLGGSYDGYQARIAQRSLVECARGFS